MADMFLTVCTAAVLVLCYFAVGRLCRETRAMRGGWRRQPRIARITLFKYRKYCDKIYPNSVNERGRR